MDTSKYQLPVASNMDINDIIETFKKIDEVYNNSLIAMGMQNVATSAVSNTNINISNVVTISTR